MQKHTLELFCFTFNMVAWMRVRITIGRPANFGSSSPLLLPSREDLCEFRGTYCKSFVEKHHSGELCHVRIIQ